MGHRTRTPAKTGRRVVVCTLPAYLRGLSFAGPYALVGMCQIREKHLFGGLPVQRRFEKLLCGVAVVDLRSGRQTAMIEFTSGVQELYEVLFLPGVRRPTILNTEKEATRQAVTAPKFSYWLRPISGFSTALIKPREPATDSQWEKDDARTDHRSNAAAAPCRVPGKFVA